MNEELFMRKDLQENIISAINQNNGEKKFRP